jgi:hypothetical protein
VKIESMRIGFLVCEELEVESCRNQDHRIAQVKIMALGLPGLEKDRLEAASERMLLGPILSPQLLLGAEVFCIFFNACMKLLVV